MTDRRPPEPLTGPRLATHLRPRIEDPHGSAVVGERYVGLSGVDDDLFTTAMARRIMDALNRRGVAVRSADAVLLLTPHSPYDLDELCGWASRLFDARNATRGRHPSTVEVL